MRELFDFHAFPLLKTERLILRELTDADATVLFQYFSDPAYVRYLSFGLHTDVEQTQGFINWTRTGYQQQEGIRWGLQWKLSDVLIGTAGLHFWKRDLRCAEVGYHVAPAWWGMGIASEVLRALVDFGFQRMNLNRIEGRHSAGNGVSGRVLLKCGFQKEGILRQREVLAGRLVDVVQFSLLREEYDATR